MKTQTNTNRISAQTFTKLGNYCLNRHSSFCVSKGRADAGTCLTAVSAELGKALTPAPEKRQKSLFLQHFHEVRQRQDFLGAWFSSWARHRHVAALKPQRLLYKAASCLDILNHWPAISLDFAFFLVLFCWLCSFWISI